MRTLRLLLVTALAATGLAVVIAGPATAAPASVASFQQCSNGNGTALTCAGGWINGSLQTSNSHYSEDGVVPQRVVINLPADNLSHSLTFTYQDRKGSVHAYDSLGTWNKTVSSADPCQGLAASLCASSPSTLTMALDGTSIPPAAGGNSTIVNTHQLPAADRQWTMYGGTLTSDVAPTHNSPVSGDDLATVTVNFTNPTPGVAHQAVLLFGGHLAVGGPNNAPRAWGVNLGASSVSGGPYAFKLEAIDGGSTGATANSIQANAAAPLPPAAFTITKSANPANATAGQGVTYTVTVTNTGGVAGSTTFTDDFDNRLSPSTAVSNPAGNNCAPGAGSFSCTTGTIAAGSSQTFTYTAAMPATFSGGGGTGGCSAGNFPVANTASLPTGTPATATVCVSAAAAFSVTKTVDDDTPVPGQTVQYTVTVTNTGAASGSTTFTDDFDDRLTPSTATSNPAGNDCTPGATSFSCTTGTIAPGGSQTFTYTAAMPATFSGSDGGGTCAAGTYRVANTATVGGNSVTREVCVSAAPEFSVTKTVDDDTATPGQTVTYTVTVTNDGTAAGSTTFTDDFDDRLTPSTATSDPAGNDCAPGATTFSCTTGTIAAGGSQTFTYTAAMPTTFDGPSGGGSCATGSFPVGNTVTLAGDATASETVCVGAAANFTIDKSVDDETPVPGQTVHYTITVTNTGSASGSTTLTDDYDDRLTPTTPVGTPSGSCTPGTGSFDCSTGTVPAGGAVTFTYEADVPETFGPSSGGGGCAAGTYPVGNTATLGSGPSADVTLCVAAAPAYTITKTVDDDSVLPGDVVTYTITVTNTGAAAGNTGFTDDFDDRLSPGTVTSTPAGGTCSVGGGGNQVLSCSTGVIPAGESQAFSYSAAVPSAFTGQSGGGACDSGAFPIVNTATLTGGSSADPVTVCVTAAPSFVVDKTVDDSSPEPGDTLTYTITVTNNGTADGSTSFTDDFDDRLSPSTATSNPAGDDCVPGAGSFTCTTGTIASLGSQTFTYTATVPTSFSGPGGEGTCAPGSFQIANAVELSGGSNDEVAVCVAAAPDFEVSKSVDDADADPGQTVTYTITVSNNGSASGSTSFTDDYDDRLTPSDPVSDPAGGSCTDDGDVLDCTTGDIEAGGSQTFTYSATLPASFTGASGGGDCGPGEFRVANSVAVTGSTSADTVDVCVAASPDFDVTKSADDTTVSAGDSVTYTVTVTNTGSAPGTGTFADDFDDRLAPSTATSDPAGNDCEPGQVLGNEMFVCTTGSIDPGEEQTFTYTAVVPETFTGDSGGGGCNPGEYPVANSVTSGSSSDAVTVCVAAAPDFGVTKEASTTLAAPGQEVTYTITVTNNGTAPGSTTFTDDYDDRLAPSPVDVAPAGGSCVDTLGELECTTSSLDASQSQTFTYTATLPETFSGAPGGGDCAPDEFPVANHVELSGAAGEAGVTVCVDADAQFTLDKSVDDPDADPGQTVSYTITVTNTGSAPGSTSFTDDYDDRLDPTDPVSDPAGGSCTDDGDVLDCTTGDIPAGESQSFSYDAVLPATYGSDGGTDGCGAGEFAVRNAAALDDGPGDSVTVCVTAAPDLTVTKTVDDTTAEPGQMVTYTITVSNGGTAAGSTAFTDDYDDRLDPTTPVSDPPGADCEQLTSGNERFECATGTIPAGGSQTFTYTAELPSIFTGSSGGGSCPGGSYPIVNSVILGSGATGGATVCVAAAPDLGLVKSSDLEFTDTGDQVLTYTLTWTNTGAAEAVDVVLTDQIPADTAFVSCTGGCSVAGSPATATWQIGSVAPVDGTGSVTLVVKVTSNQACSITNTAQIRAGSGPATSSNTVVDNVSPQADPSGAKSSGSAVGVQIKTNGLITLITNILNVIVSNNGTVTASRTSSSQSGVGSNTGSDSLLSLKLPANGSLFSAGVLTATSASSVTAAPPEARQTSTSSVANLCLVPINGVCTVSVDAVRAVASTMANGSFASTSSGGTTIAKLKVVGLGQVVDLNQTTLIPLNPGIFGKNSYVAINERTASSGLVGGKYVADMKVSMIHLKITGLLGLQAADIVVAQAVAHSEFPKTFVCAAAREQSVSGHAYVARLYTGPLLADLLQGFVAITPFGGDESQQVVALSLPENGSIAGAQVADSRSRGWFTDTSSNAVSHAEIAGDGVKPACVLRTGATCVVTATAIRSEARSLATVEGSTSTDAGSQLIGLGVLGVPIVTQPKPNTTIELPGIGFIILNEQFCDSGSVTNTHSCSAAQHSGITVRALRVVITVANNILGLNPGIELVVAEAHADSTYVG